MSLILVNVVAGCETSDCQRERRRESVWDFIGGKVQMRRSQEANGQHKSPWLIREDKERENVIDADRETQDERERRRKKEEERKKRRHRGQRWWTLLLSARTSLIHSDSSRTDDPIKHNSIRRTDGIILLWLPLYTIALRAAKAFSRSSLMHAGKLHKTLMIQRIETQREDELSAPPAWYFLFIVKSYVRNWRQISKQCGTVTVWFHELRA